MSIIPPGWVILITILVVAVLFQLATWFINLSMWAAKKRYEMFPALTTAQHLADLFGEDLVGKYVTTYDYGECRGGRFRVTKINPDTAAPEIVFNIAHPDHEEIGVFDHEDIYYDGVGHEQERRGED